MVIFYKKWKKYNEFQLTKNKMDLNIRKMTNHPPSPELSGNRLPNIKTFDNGWSNLSENLRVVAI